MFNKYDVDNSNTIDKHETRKILFDLGLDYSLDRAENLLSILLEEGQEELNFDGFCKFFILLKRGDERLGEFQSIIDQFNSTSLCVLEAQAKTRDLKINIVTLEEREMTSTHPATFVVEVIELFY